MTPLACPHLGNRPTNTLLTPLSGMVNRRMAPPQDAEPEESESISDYTLKFVTTDKSDTRVRAMALERFRYPN